MHTRGGGGLLMSACVENNLKANVNRFFTTFTPYLISFHQLDMFRELYQGFFMEPSGQLEMLHIEDNFRPVQELYGRQVIRSGFPSRAGMGYSANKSANLISVNLFLLLSAIMAFVCRSLQEYFKYQPRLSSFPKSIKFLFLYSSRTLTSLVLLLSCFLV